MFKIKSFEQTYSASPSQWEIQLDDGRMMYIRYRWGYLSICVSPNKTNDIGDAVCGREILGKEIGDSLDGFLSFQELQEHTKHILEWPEEI